MPDWARLGLNQRLLPCEGSTLPLSYAPVEYLGIIRKIWPVVQRELRITPGEGEEGCCVSVSAHELARSSLLLVAVQVIGGEDSLLGDDAGDEMGWGHVEGGVVAFDAGPLDRRPDPHGLEGEVGVPHLDGDGVVGGMAEVRGAGDEGRDAEVLGADGDLAGAHLVEDIAVDRDGVGCAGEEVDVLIGHHEGRHVVGDDGGVEAHLA